MFRSAFMSWLARPSVLLAGGCLVAAPMLAGAAFAATSEVVDRTALRVCADPSNLPFSNRDRAGFENEIAELLAKELGVPVKYTWFPQVVGFVRQTLHSRKCDLIVGISLGFELLQNTNPYYRSTYALIYRADSGLSATSLKDPALKDRKFGVVAGTPPAYLLAEYGLLDKLRPYHLMVDTRFNKPGKRMVEDVAKGEIDVGVLWGPIAGYYALNHNPPLTVVPLRSAPGQVRMEYRITMGVRFNEPEWKRKIYRLIKKKQPDIDAILARFGVPLLDEQGNLIQPSAMPAAAQSIAEPKGYRMNRFRAPTPASIQGGITVSTQEVRALVEKGGAVLVDVLPRPPKPKGLKKGTIWRPPPRRNIPGSVWLPNTGFGALSPEYEAYFRQNLARLTDNDKARPVLFYCLKDCWMSWNAAKRAIADGYTKVYWYPEGTDGWRGAGLALQPIEPIPLADGG